MRKVEHSSEQSAEQSETKNTGRKMGPSQERLGIKVIEAVKRKRREGMTVRAISEDMGIGLGTVSVHTRGIKPKKTNGEARPEEPNVHTDVQQANGGEIPVLSEPKPTRFQIPIDLDPQLILLLAGDSARLGFPSVTKYIQEYNIPWIAAITEGADIIGAKTPAQYREKLTEIIKGYLAFKKMVSESQKEAEKTVVKRDGQQGTGS